MATSNHCDGNEDFTVCPICFEKYQTPRSLPCTHTFCHRCLSAHINSSCKDCDPAFGFPCPVCRSFVPAPGVLRQYPTKDWASRFPENLFLSSCVRKQTSLTNISCGPCRIDCEIDIKADSWCVECEDSLCEKCSQNHRKYKALQSHQILPITNNGLDYTKSLKDIDTGVLKCEKHEKRNIEFVCETHQTGCCSICVVNEHKHCENNSTLLKAVDTFSDETKVNLVQEIKDLLLKIETIVQKEKQNISDVDDKKDIYTEKIMKMIEEMVNQLKTQEKTYLDQLAEISKHARQRLEGSLRLLEHRKQYLAHWLEIVSTDSPNKEADSELLLNCLKTNEVLGAVKGLPLIQMNFDLSAEVSCGIKKIISLGTLFSPKLTENYINFSVIPNETIKGKLETPNSSISNAKTFSEWFSSSEVAEKSSEWESCSIRTEDSCEWDSRSKKVDKSYKCDARSNNAENSCDWNISSEEVEKSRERDSCSKTAEKSREWNSSSKKGKISSEWNLCSGKGKEIYRECNSSFEAIGESCMQNSNYKKAGKFNEWDSCSKEEGTSCDWTISFEEVEKPSERDICSEKADKYRERDSCSKKAEKSHEWNSSSEKAGKSCKWDSGSEKGKISSEWNLCSGKGKEIYREGSSSFEATNKSCVQGSNYKKSHEWNSCSKEARKSCDWNINSETVEKSREKDSCSYKAEISRESNSSSGQAGKSWKWDSGFKEGKVSSEWNSGSNKGIKINRECNSSFETIENSFVGDLGSQEAENPRERGTCFQKVEKSHEWDSRSKKAGKSRERHSLTQGVVNSDYWDSCSQRAEKCHEQDLCSQNAEVSCEWNSCLTQNTGKSRKA